MIKHSRRSLAGLKGAGRSPENDHTQDWSPGRPSLGVSGGISLQELNSWLRRGVVIDAGRHAS